MIDLKKLAAIFTLGVLYFAAKGTENDIVEEPVVHPESTRCANAAAYAAISALAKSAKDATYESQMLKAAKGTENDIVEEPVVHPESTRCANAAAYAAISALAKSAKDATYESQMLKAATDIYDIAKKHPELAAFAITKLSKISEDCNYTSSSQSINDMITKLV